MFEEDQVSARSENHEKLQRNRSWPDLCAPARVRKNTTPRPERALVLKAFGAQQREKSVCGNQVCWKDVGAGPEVPCKGWECCGSGEGKGVSKPEENGMAWDLKAGFASWLGVNQKILPSQRSREGDLC